MKNKISLILGILALVGIGAWQVADNTEEYCYALRRSSRIQSGEHDYAFLRYQQFFNRVQGTLENYPYGTDSMTGALKGSVTQNTDGQDVLSVWYDYEAEGMNETEQRFILLATPGAHLGYGDLTEDNRGRFIYTDPSAVQYTFAIPQVSCDTYDQIYGFWQDVN